MAENCESSSEVYVSQETHLVIHHEVPEKTTDTETMPSDSKVKSCVDKPVEPEAANNKTATLAPLLEMSNSLDEFMDVVTTYKCKFCPFSCEWKSGLMSHIRSTHFEKTLGKLRANASSNGPSQSSERAKSSVAAKPSTVLPSLPPKEEPGSVRPDELGTDANKNDDAVVAEKQIFLCGECNQGFGSLAECENHMVQDHQLKIKKKPSNSENEKGQNVKSVNIRKKACKRKVRPPRALEEDYVLNRRRQRVSDDPDRSFRCTRRGCSQRFRSEEKLDYHAKCHVADAKHFVCPVCDAEMENWRILSIHLWKLHTIDADLYNCSDCTYKTYSSFKLATHQQIHGDERAFSCSTCGKSFKQVSQLRNHAVIHKDRKNMTEKRWYSEQKCDICQRNFSDSKCLRKHLQAVHSKLKPFSCTYCGHRSARKAMLELHMRQHTGEKPFHCSQCDYRTGDHNSLRRHKMRHTGTKPYKCPHCSYASIQAISYKTHLKNKHPGLEGLYACHLCHFRSVNRDNYLNHIDDHSRDPKSVNSETQMSPEPPPPPLPAPPLGDKEQVSNNTAAAQLIYSCLNALTHENEESLSVGISASSTNGTQTITFQLPETSQEVAGAERYYLTVRQPQELAETDLHKEQPQTCYTLAAVGAADTTVHFEATADVTINSDMLSSMQLVPVSDVLTSESSATSLQMPLIIKHPSV